MNQIIGIADTSALVAMYNTKDTEHDRCRAARGAVAHLVISPLVLAELDYLVTSRMGTETALTVLEHIMDRVDVRRYEVPEVAAHLRSAHALMRRYQDMAIGLTDAVNVALAAEFRTDTILTLDRRHFRTLRPLTGHPQFRLLPDDLPA